MLLCDMVPISLSLLVAPAVEMGVKLERKEEKPQPMFRATTEVCLIDGVGGWVGWWVGGWMVDGWWMDG